MKAEWKRILRNYAITALEAVSQSFNKLICGKSEPARQAAPVEGAGRWVSMSVRYPNCCAYYTTTQFFRNVIPMKPLHHIHSRIFCGNLQAL